MHVSCTTPSKFFHAAAVWHGHQPYQQALHGTGELSGLSDMTIGVASTDMTCMTKALAELMAIPWA